MSHRFWQSHNNTLVLVIGIESINTWFIADAVKLDNMPRLPHILRMLEMSSLF